MTGFWLGAAIAVGVTGLVKLWRDGRLSTRSKGYSQPGSKTIDMALERLNIARTPHPLVDCPEFQVHLAVEQEAPSFVLPDSDRLMPAYGDLYQLVFHAESSLLNGIRLRSKHPILHELTPWPGARLNDFYELDCNRYDQWVLFTPDARTLLLQAHPLEIKRGCLMMPVVPMMFQVQNPPELAQALKPGVATVTRFLKLLRRVEPLAARQLIMAALDGEPWFRYRAAEEVLARLSAGCAFGTGSLSQRLAAFADAVGLETVSEPQPDETLFDTLLQPLLQRHTGFAACFLESSLQVEQTQAHPHDQNLQAEDVAVEAWLVLANLFPEIKWPDAFLEKADRIAKEMGPLVWSLLSRLNEERQDQLLPFLWTNPALRKTVVWDYVRGHDQRCERLIDAFFRGDDLPFQTLIVQFLHRTDDHRVRPFLARAVPHMLAAGLEPDALDGFLVAVLRCLGERGELEDLALIETCRAHVITEEATTAGRAALQAVCDRLNVSLQGLLTPVQPGGGQGALSRVGDHRADSRLGALTRKEGGDEPSCNDRLEEE